MYNLNLKNGNTSIFVDNTHVFDNIELSLQKSNGHNISEPFKEIRKSEKETILITENDMLTCSLTAISEDDILVIKVKASLKPELPLFKKQVYLNRDAGVVIKLAIEEKHKYMAIYQHKDWWLRPAFFNGNENIPDKTQLLLWKKDNYYYAMIAVCGKQYRSDLSSDDNGICIKLSSNCEALPDCEDLAFVVCNGIDPHKCCEEAVNAATKYSGTPNKLRKHKKFPDIFNYFGWCSWDAFYHEVSEEGIFKKVDELKQKGVPARWILIDDGWSAADYHKQELIGLDADEKKFPNGIASTITRLKSEYSISYVGLWQAIMGYWNGLKPESKADRTFAAHIKILPDGRHIPDTQKSFEFWNTWHSYLSKCGVDFVKVDSQSSTSLFYSGNKTYGESSRAMQLGLEASAALYFDKNIINCMGMAPEDMWNRSTSAVSRSSDDFVPNALHGFREHAIQNGYNSLLHGQFYWGDWDMFWSKHSENWQNSVLRAISGGPVYISDGLGDTDISFIEPLILDNGFVLSCQDVGLPTADCVLEDPITTSIPFKLFNRFNECFIIAAFNINQNESVASGFVTQNDIPQMPKKTYLVYSFKSQTVNIISDDEKIAITLNPNDAEIYLLIPYNNYFTPIGLLEKYISPATIESMYSFDKQHVVMLKQGGLFGFVSDKEPQKITVNGEVALAKRMGETFIVDCSKYKKPVICVYTS